MSIQETGKKSGIDRIYILGLGAIGSIYAARLHDRNPETLKAIAGPERIAAYERAGVLINGRSYHFNYISPGQKSEPADLIIIAVKFADLEQGIRDISGFIGENTTVLSLLNGVLSEELIGNSIGLQHMIYGFTTATSMRESVTTQYATIGKIVFGERTNEQLSQRVQAVKTLFDEANIPYEIPVDMLRAQWKKFMMNTGYNQASAILKAPTRVFHEEGPARELMLKAADEVVQISQQAGIGLNQSDLEDFVSTINKLDPSFKTSMLQDIEAGRKSELENFSGAVRLLGQKYHIPTPVNNTLYLTIKAMERISQN